jgi:hypothetical protein
MSDPLKGFFGPDDAKRAAEYAGTDAAQGRYHSLQLRRQHEAELGQLQRRLPFTWQPGIKVARYQGPPIFPRSAPAVHIMLLQDMDGPYLMRRAGDWLCSPAIDYETGELRYEAQRAPQWADGTGGPGSHYDQKPTCKNCLSKALQLYGKG